MGDRNNAHGRGYPGCLEAVGCCALHIAYMVALPHFDSKRTTVVPFGHLTGILSCFFYALAHVLLLEQYFKHPVVPVFTDFCECALS
jgi:hypothetical protein